MTAKLPEVAITLLVFTRATLC